jgi:hypothetical protein
MLVPFFPRSTPRGARAISSLAGVCRRLNYGPSIPGPENRAIAGRVSPGLIDARILGTTEIGRTRYAADFSVASEAVPSIC